MRKVVPIIFFLMLFTTSCIEIVEEVTVNPDRSGTISYSIESDQLTALFSNLAGIFDQNSLKEMLTKRFEQFAMKFKNSRGIKNVRFIIGDNITDASLSFDFSNTKELNEALYEIAGSKKTFFAPSYLKIGKHKLKKFNIAPYLKKQLRDQDILIPEEVMNMVEIKSIYNFPGKIKSVKGKSATMSENQQTVIQKFEFKKVYENEVNTGVRIKY
jgi:hypothetical protein